MSSITTNTSNCDPFSFVYNAIMEQMQNNPKLQKHISSRNFIDFKNASSRKRQISSADLPEIMLIVTGMSDSEDRTNSSNYGIDVEYSIVITSGSEVVVKTLEIAWQLYRTLRPWCKRLSQLEHDGEKFVHGVVFEASEVGLDDTEANRGLSGWVTVWPITVEMMFKKSTMEDC